MKQSGHDAGTGTLRPGLLPQHLPLLMKGKSKWQI